MSFLSERKEEILEQQIKSACCRRALLAGVLFSKGYIDEGKISVRVDGENVFEFISSLVTEIYSSTVEKKSSKKGGRGQIITFSSLSADKYLNSLKQPATPSYVANPKCKDGCVSAFLRGVFLASGRLNDPKKHYRLELVPIENHNRLIEVLEALGMSFSYAQRRSEKIVYTSNSTVIEDFFTAAGMTKTALIIMDEKIRCEFETSVRRASICETNNIGKAVDTSSRQCKIIEALIKANLLSSLSDELEMTARLRYKFPDYSLTRLAAEFTPPITKSGLAHRLNRLQEIAERLLNNKNKQK